MEVTWLRDPARLTFELLVEPEEVDPLLDLYRPLTQWVDPDLSLFVHAERGAGTAWSPAADRLGPLSGAERTKTSSCSCNCRRHCLREDNQEPSQCCGAERDGCRRVGDSEDRCQYQEATVNGILTKKNRCRDRNCYLSHKRNVCDRGVCCQCVQSSCHIKSANVRHAQSCRLHREDAALANICLKCKTSPRDQAPSEGNSALKADGCSPFSVLLFLFEEEVSARGRVARARRMLERSPWRLHHSEAPPRRTLNLSPLSLDYFCLSEDLPVWGVRQVHYGKEHIRVMVQTRKDTFEDNVGFYRLILGLSPDLLKDDFCLFTVHSQIHFDIQFALKRGEEASDPPSTGCDLCPLTSRAQRHSARLRFKVSELGQLVALFPNVCQPINNACWLTTDHDGNEVVLDVTSSMTSSSSSSSSSCSSTSSAFSDRGVGSMESSCGSTSSSDVSFDSQDSGHGHGSGMPETRWDPLASRKAPRGGDCGLGAVTSGSLSTLRRFTRTKSSSKAVVAACGSVVTSPDGVVAGMTCGSATKNDGQESEGDVVLRKETKSSLKKDCNISDRSGVLGSCDVRKIQRHVTFCLDDIYMATTSFRSDCDGTSGSGSDVPRSGQSALPVKVRLPVPHRTSSLPAAAVCSSPAASTSQPPSASLSVSAGLCPPPALAVLDKEPVSMFPLRFDTCPTAPLSRNNRREEQIGFYV